MQQHRQSKNIPKIAKILIIPPANNSNNKNNTWTNRNLGIIKPKNKNGNKEKKCYMDSLINKGHCSRYDTDVTTWRKLKERNEIILNCRKTITHISVKCPVGRQK